MVFKDGLYPIFSEALTLLKLSVIPLGAFGRSVPDGDCYAKLVGNVSNT